MSNLNTLIARMIEYEDGCVERVNHFLKVFAFAKTIAEGEGLDRETQDILVNIFENGMAQEAARKIRDNIFKTKTGRKLLTDLYL